MKINHNMSATIANKRLLASDRSLSASVERLSTGLKINRASDDAAGMAISSKMKTQIRGLNQASQNASDGISVLDTADGALTEVHSMLQRMRELSVQAANNATYTPEDLEAIQAEISSLRDEIDRISKDTEFNKKKLLDGSLRGEHDGSDLNATGKMKIHFGTGNNSAEDYYYVEIGACTLAGLGLREPEAITRQAKQNQIAGDDVTAQNTFVFSRGIPSPGQTQTLPVVEHDPPRLLLNDAVVNTPDIKMPTTGLETMQNLFQAGQWVWGLSNGGNEENNFMFVIPKGTKNIVINMNGYALQAGMPEPGHNDIQLFTFSVCHLAGTPRGDISWTFGGGVADNNQARLPFKMDQYDGSILNDGPAAYDPVKKTLAYSSYNGMAIGFSGDPDRHETGIGMFDWNDGVSQKFADYEILTIDEATEDLIVWLPGSGSARIKAYWDLPDDVFNKPAQLPPERAPQGGKPPAPGTPPGPGLVRGDIISIKTKQLAQEALPRLEEAMVKKDNVRAHLGAMQNRLENTVTNLSIQAENMQAAESQISDVDVATEMTEFVRSRILAQASAAMLSQANTLPRMLAGVLDA